MAEVKFEEFEDAIAQAMVHVVAQGYHPYESKPPDILDFCRMLVPDVCCKIRFALLPYSPGSGSIREFDVWLIRTRLPDFPSGDQIYLPLTMDLCNLMRFFYRHPLGEFLWLFTDQHSLLKQLAEVQALLLDYGIKWLEDPTSDMKWIRQQR